MSINTGLVPGVLMITGNKYEHVRLTNLIPKRAIMARD